MDILQVYKATTHALLPSAATDGSAGYDLYSIGTTNIRPFSRGIIDTGIIVTLPPGTYGRIADKSGLAAGSGLFVGGGVIDSDYTGTLKVILFNQSNDDITIGPSIAIAQLICEVYKKPVIVEKVCAPVPTTRGEQGLGSGISKPSLLSTNHSKYPNAICTCLACENLRTNANKGMFCILVRIFSKS